MSEATFRFPEVDSAYVPSGRTTPKAVVLMLAFGAVAAYLVSFGTAPAIAWIGRLSNAIELPFIDAVVELPLKVLVAVVAAALVGSGVLGGGLLGENRSVRTAVAIGLVCGAAALLFTVRGMFDRPGDPLGPISGILVAAAFLAVPPLVAKAETEADEYCELDERFMVKRPPLRVALDDEERALAALRDRRLEELAALRAAAGGGDDCTLHVAACPQCGQGFVHLITGVTKKRTDENGRETSFKETRRVFSAAMPREAIDSLPRGEEQDRKPPGASGGGG